MSVTETLNEGLKRGYSLEIAAAAIAAKVDAAIAQVAPAGSAPAPAPAVAQPAASPAVAPATEANVADTILAVAARVNADLVVAGAFGHSRMREWAFGGVTRALLTRAPCAVLFSH